MVRQFAEQKLNLVSIWLTLKQALSEEGFCFDAMTLNPNVNLPIGKAEPCAVICLLTFSAKQK